LALAYVPQHEIARRVEVSEATISKDLKAIREEWREEAKADVQAALMREIRSLDRLEAQMWSQLAGSVDPDVKTRTANTIIRCKERRAKLYGFDRPDLIDLRITAEQAAEVIEQDIAELEAIIEGRVVE